MDKRTLIKYAKEFLALENKSPQSVASYFGGKIVGDNYIYCINSGLTIEWSDERWWFSNRAHRLFINNGKITEVTTENITKTFINHSLKEVLYMSKTVEKRCNEEYELDRHIIKIDDEIFYCFDTPCAKKINGKWEIIQK